MESNILVSLQASVYCYTRRPVLQRVYFEVSADHLSYTRHFSYQHACVCQFSKMSKTGSPIQDENILKERGKWAVMFH